MNAKRKVKIRLFILDLIFEIIVNSVILVVAWFSNRMIETLLFYIAWRLFRYCVPKVFHIKCKSPIVSIIGCGICSIACYIVSIQFMLPINISIFFSFALGMLINMILFYICDYLDLRKERNKTIINLYNMTEEEIRKYCKSKHLSEMIIDTVILRVIHNYKWVDIAKERNYTKDGIRYHKERIYKVLNVKI